jgi:hypothetical protein
MCVAIAPGLKTHALILRYETQSSNFLATSKELVIRATTLFLNVSKGNFKAALTIVLFHHLRA